MAKTVWVNVDMTLAPQPALQVHYAVLIDASPERIREYSAENPKRAVFTFLTKLPAERYDDLGEAYVCKPMYIGNITSSKKDVVRKCIETCTKDGRWGTWVCDYDESLTMED
jgi:hypothetical protein